MTERSEANDENDGLAVFKGPCRRVLQARRLASVVAVKLLLFNGMNATQIQPNARRKRQRDVVDW